MSTESAPDSAPDPSPAEIGAGESPPATPEQLTTRPSIWAGSWLDYNNGVLHGAWIDAGRDDADIWQDIQAVLDTSPTAKQYGEVAEDWGVFDHEGFGTLKIGESETVEWIGAVGRGIAEHGPAFAAYAEVMEDQEALGGFDDDYLGGWDSLADYGESIVTDMGWQDQIDKGTAGLRLAVRHGQRRGPGSGHVAGRRSPRCPARWGPGVDIPQLVASASSRAITGKVQSAAAYTHQLE